MASNDRKLDRAIGMMAWEAIKAQPDITRNELYEKLGVFSTKQIKRVLKPYEGIHWNVRKEVAQRGYSDYVTTYRYRLIDGSDFNK